MLKIVKDYSLKDRYDYIGKYDDFYNILYKNIEVGFVAINYNSINMIYIFVENKYRGNGLGTIAFNEILKKLKSNTKRIVLTFDKDNLKMFKIVNHYNAIIKNQNSELITYEIDIGV